MSNHDDRPMAGIGDLALALGGSETSFTGDLLRLIAKSDPGNRTLLRTAYPRQVLAYELWMATSPAPTLDRFRVALDAADTPGYRFGAPWPTIGGSSIDVRPDMDQAPWTDLPRKDILHGQVERAGLLRHGTSDGRASVALVVRLDDGRPVVAETTWRLFNTAARALAASPAAREEV